MKLLEEIDEKLIAELQGNLPITVNPYATIAEKLAISEDEVVSRLKKMRSNGCLKRISAILKHQKSGYKANAMFVMQVPANKINEIGSRLAKEKLVSHCYERTVYENWPYNLYAMLHSREMQEIEEFVQKFTQQEVLTKYQLLVSEQELKKTSMIYF